MGSSVFWFQVFSLLDGVSLQNNFEYLFDSYHSREDKLRENFVNVPFDEENSELEQSDNEDDVDSERNIFDDIIIDDE